MGEVFEGAALLVNISVSLIVARESGERTTDPGVMLGSSSMLLIWLPFHGLPGSNSGTRSVREGWAGAGHWLSLVTSGRGASPPAPASGHPPVSVVRPPFDHSPSAWFNPSGFRFGEE